MIRREEAGPVKQAAIERRCADAGDGVRTVQGGEQCEADEDGLVLRVCPGFAEVLASWRCKPVPITGQPKNPCM